MFEQFDQWRQNRHEYAQAWKERTGGKVMGYYCTYVPEEILYAAGVLPVRIFGSHEPDNVTEPHMFGMFCPFSRDCLAQVLRGKYDYLDGSMIAQSCLHIRQAFWSGKMHRPRPFNYYLPMPHDVQSPRAKPYLRGELERFKMAVEEWTGKVLTRADLQRGIEIMDRNRRLLRQVYELRQGEHPPLSGAEAMNMVISAQMVDKEEHSRALEHLLGELPGRRVNGHKDDLRLMIVGSEDDDIEFLRMVEDLGAVFVADDHCTGSRYFWNEVEPEEDLLAAIAGRYVDRTPCPTKDWPQRRRFDQVLQFARDYKVKAALLVQQKFCDPHETDMPALAKVLGEAGVPAYPLEFDITTPLGPFRTRVEAFLETLRDEDLFD
ncbi:MAG: benzoyl-CoA reductase, bzd-type, subunit N [Chloroflexi bacterium]|nr:benzoyl-CoA reductase, bzd-type, subunit N [Chloroflexota bacterium]